MNEKDNNIFYVYAYLDPLKQSNFNFNGYVFNYEPFYIGKGHNTRLNHFLKVKKSRNSHLFYKIKKLKLHNVDPIVIKIPVSDETKKKISDKLKGRKGQRHTQETKNKISNTLKGKSFTEERKSNISKALKLSFLKKTELIQ